MMSKNSKNSLFKALGVTSVIVGAVLELALSKAYLLNFLILGFAGMAFCAACDGLVTGVAKTGGRPLFIHKSKERFHYWFTICGWFVGSVVLGLIAFRWNIHKYLES